MATEIDKILVVASDWGFPNDHQKKCSRCSKTIFCDPQPLKVPQNATVVFCCKSCFLHMLNDPKVTMHVIDKRVFEELSMLIIGVDETGQKRLRFWGKPRAKK